MQLQIQAPEDLTHAARAAIERRVRLLLGSHAVRVERAQVTVFPTDRGATGCRIRLRMRDGDSMDVEDRAEDPTSAASAAAWRLGHRVRRRLLSTECAVASHRAGLRQQRAHRPGFLLESNFSTAAIPSSAQRRNA